MSINKKSDLATVCSKLFSRYLDKQENRNEIWEKETAIKSVLEIWRKKELGLGQS